MLESLHNSGWPVTAIEDAWNREIEHRVAVYESGENTLFGAADVVAEGRRIAS